MRARHGNPNGTDIILFTDDGAVAVKPDDKRLAGIEIEPFAVDDRTAVRSAFERRVAAGLPVAGQDGAVALDPDSRRELATAVLMATLGAWPAEGFWRLTDNTNLPLSAPRLTALGLTAAGYYQLLFATRSALLDAVDAGHPVDAEGAWPAPSPFDPAA